jgi:UDP-arabinose 4-epimerase
VGERVLVTGGAGYIGSHTCKALANAGFEPVVFDNLSAGHAGAVRWGPLVKGDTRDRAALDAALRSYQPKAVLHFAARIAVGESVVDPASHYSNNVVGSLTLLEAARAAGVEQFVFSSSAAVYGTPQRVPMGEDHAKLPINPYGRTKLVIEDALRDYQAAYGIKSACLRYFNAAGADEAGEIGELHDPETHLIPLVLDAASGRSNFITVFGDDYDTPDGTCIRDYVHVSDLADAHVIALRAIATVTVPSALNVGIGRGYSVMEVINCVRSLTGKEVAVRLGPRRDGDPPVLVAECGLLRGQLGWNPVHSDIETIVRTAWAWHQGSKFGC